MTWNSRPPTTGPGAGGTEAGSIGLRIESLTAWVIDPNTWTTMRRLLVLNVISWPGVLQAGADERAGADRRAGAGGIELSAWLSFSLPLLSPPPSLSPVL